MINCCLKLLKLMFDIYIFKVKVRYRIIKKSCIIIIITIIVNSGLPGS